MAQRAFLHVGTADSGTTLLQQLWRRHRDGLRERGLLYLTPDEVDALPALLEKSRAWDGDILISHEAFADASDTTADDALAGLRGVANAVHLLITPRDLAHALASAWQQHVLQGEDQPLESFLEAMREAGPEHAFWRQQDLPAIARRWSRGLPHDHVHLVVAAADAPGEDLWLRTARALGIDVSGLDSLTEQSHESLSLVEAELLRRVITRIHDEHCHVALRRLSEGLFLREHLTGSTPGGPLMLPAEHAEWIRARAEDDVRELREQAYDVIGDLADLIPAAADHDHAAHDRAPHDLAPHEVTPTELVTAAATVVSRMVKARAARVPPGGM